jgi:uncharacterized protein (TIGR03032 family)
MQTIRHNRLREDLPIKMNLDTLTDELNHVQFCSQIIRQQFPGKILFLYVLEGRFFMSETASPVTIECVVTPAFATWLQQANSTVAATTYQAGKVVFLSWDGQQVSLLARQFDKPMGLTVNGSQMALGTRHHVTLLADAPLLARDYLPEHPGRYDGLFLPRVSYHTGDLNVHDLAFGKAGLWLVNTRFSCLAGLSHSHCFVPRWKPPFVSEIAPEDRCHLNGLAMVDGEPRFVTALGTTDSPGAWRAEKAVGGVIMEVPSGEILVRGLAMPHSPRWHHGALWFLNSGAGQLCRYDPASRQIEVVCEFPSYLRGLHLFGDLALVGMCQIREHHIFGGLPVQQKYGERLLCGIMLVNLQTGQEVGRCEFTSGCTELFEVQLIAGLRRPMIVNADQEVSRRAFPAADFSYWLRPQSLMMDYTRDS